MSERMSEHIDLCWKQVGGLVHALDTRTRMAHRRWLMSNDDALGDLEAKAHGLADALHEIRLLRRFVSAPASSLSGSKDDT